VFSYIVFSCFGYPGETLALVVHILHLKSQQKIAAKNASVNRPLGYFEAKFVLKFVILVKTRNVELSECGPMSAWLLRGDIGHCNEWMTM
jgi:hypothetical protein